MVSLKSYSDRAMRGERGIPAGMLINGGPRGSDGGGWQSMAGGQELQGLKWLERRSSPQTIRARNARCRLGHGRPAAPRAGAPPSNITNTPDNCRPSAPAPVPKGPSLAHPRRRLGLISGFGFSLRRMEIEMRSFSVW